MIGIGLGYWWADAVAAGLISLDVPHMPKRFQNSVIFGSIHGCSIKQNILKPNGSTYTATRGDDFLVSGDKNVRPINMRWGPAGDIYLIDWHDQNPCHQTAPDLWDYERGRVYRIQLKGTKTNRPEDLGKKTTEELTGLVKSDNPYEARTALRLIQQRPGGGSATALLKDEGARLAFAARTGVEREQMSKQLFDALVDGAKKGTDPRVRRELASAAVRLAEEKYDVTPLLRALMAHAEDAKDPVIPQLVWLAYEKVVAKKEGASTPAEKELGWLADEAPLRVEGAL